VLHLQINPWLMSEEECKERSGRFFADMKNVMRNARLRVLSLSASVQACPAASLAQTWARAPPCAKPQIPCCKPLPVLDVRTLEMHRKLHSGVEQCESTVLAPAPAWCKRVLAVETGQHGPGLHGPRPVCHARAGWGRVRGGQGPGLHVPRPVLPC